MKKTSQFTQQEKNWILYDVANSAYVLLTTALFSFFLTHVSGIQETTPVWSDLNAVVTIIAVVLCPILGTFADFGHKKKFFMIFAFTGMISCALLSILGFIGNVSPIIFVLFAILYIITEIGYSSANVFYDSMLSDVTTDEKTHKVSANGYAWGYVGSCIPFIVCLILFVLAYMVFRGDVVSSSIVNGKESTIYEWPYLGLAFGFGCLITAAWWFFLTRPLLKTYEQVHFLPKPEKPIRETFKRLGHIFKDLAKNKKALFFIIGFFFYIDGVHTIIKMAMSIGNDLNFDFGPVQLVIALFVTQLVAFPCAIIFGKLASKYSCEKLLVVCILGYTAIGVLAVLLREPWQFWVMAVGVGAFQGGIQAMSRSYFTKIIPAEKSGEFFGIYDIFGKSAAIVGLLLIGGLSKQFPLSVPILGMNVSLIPLPILFLIGLVFFLISIKMPAQTQDTEAPAKK